jgi:hypothetical protein
MLSGDVDRGLPCCNVGLRKCPDVSLTGRKKTLSLRMTVAFHIGPPQRGNKSSRSAQQVSSIVFSIEDAGASPFRTGYEFTSVLGLKDGIVIRSRQIVDKGCAKATNRRLKSRVGHPRWLRLV